MDPLWILIAFLIGFAVYQVGLPPLVGYLIAGFVLEAIGVEGGETLEEIANMAVFLVSSENRFMTGAKIVADGGL